MLTVHATGTLVADPEQRTSASGTAWLRLKVSVPSGQESVFVSVAVFDGDLIDRLAPLHKGDSISLAGTAHTSAWLKDGEAKAGLNMVANAAISRRDGRPKRRAR